MKAAVLDRPRAARRARAAQRPDAHRRPRGDSDRSPRRRHRHLEHQDPNGTSAEGDEHFQLILGTDGTGTFAAFGPRVAARPRRPSARRTRTGRQEQVLRRYVVVAAENVGAARRRSICCTQAPQRSTALTAEEGSTSVCTCATGVPVPCSATPARFRALHGPVSPAAEARAWSQQRRVPHFASTRAHALRRPSASTRARTERAGQAATLVPNSIEDTCSARPWRHARALRRAPVRRPRAHGLPEQHSSESRARPAPHESVRPPTTRRPAGERGSGWNARSAGALDRAHRRDVPARAAGAGARARRKGRVLGRVALHIRRQ